jgi:hypothetical protein
MRIKTMEKNETVRPIKKNGYSHKKLDARKHKRYEDALKRQHDYDMKNNIVKWRY